MTKPLFDVGALVCPLCEGGNSEFFFEDKHRSYFCCAICALVFVPECFHLSDRLEKHEYDKHQNSPLDEGYRQFLSRISQPMLARLTPGAKGLDFGCGPGPTLSGLFEERGFSVALFDKFYCPDTRVLNREYDFVTATEVLEHLRCPKVTLEQLWSCVSVGGVLGVMTKLVIDLDKFSRWHYKNDPTHIVFFSNTTFDWLANYWAADIVHRSQDVTIFKKVMIE